ncbi:unnamed protein product, partial [Iphiclides podalirius]
MKKTKEAPLRRKKESQPIGTAARSAPTALTLNCAASPCNYRGRSIASDWRYHVSLAAIRRLMRNSPRAHPEVLPRLREISFDATLQMP